MKSFEEATLRLKQQLRVTEDQQAAELLGLTGQAWVKRKKRESFPTKEVFALAQRRPELMLDPDWIVTGSSKRAETAEGDETSLLECYRLMNSSQKHQLRQIALLWSGTMKLTTKNDQT